MSVCLRANSVVLKVGLLLCLSVFASAQTNETPVHELAPAKTLSSETPSAKEPSDDRESQSSKTDDIEPKKTPEETVSGVTTITSIDEVLALTPEQAANQLLVRIEGTVHAFNPVHDSVFLNTAEHQIYVRYFDSRRLTIGQRVRVEGKTLNGITNNIVVASQVDVLEEHVDLNVPIPITLEGLNPEAYDCKWVQVNNLKIETAVADGEMLTLVGRQNDAFLYVSAYGSKHQAELAQLIGTTVSVRGNLGVFAIGNQVKGAALNSHPDLIVETKPAETPLRMMPFIEIGAVWLKGTDQFRTQGMVTFRDDYGLFLEDDTGGTWFTFDHPLPFLEPGTTVEAVGFRNKGATGVELQLRLINIHHKSALPKVEVTRVEDLSNINESTRVCLVGKLEDYQYNSDRALSELVIRSGADRILVNVPSDLAKHKTLNLSTASVLSVTGTITFAPQSPQDTRFDLRMFSPSFNDIEVGVRKGIWRYKAVQYGLLCSSLILAICLLWGYRNRLSDMRTSRKLVGLSAQLRSSYDSIRDGILIVDAYGSIIEANRKAREFFEYDFEVCRSSSDFETALATKLNNQDFLEFWSTHNANFLNTAESVFELNSPQRRILEVFTSPVESSDDGIKARLWAFYDVTERWRLQDSLVHAQKQEAIGRLAGGIAHDFNNFLTGISGNLFVAKLDGTKTVAEVSESLDAAQGAARRAAALVSNLLGFSQKTPLNRREICVNDVVQHMASLLQPSVPSSIQLQFDLQSELPKVSADPVQLEQVLLNICINARDSLDQKWNRQQFLRFSEAVSLHQTGRNERLTNDTSSASNVRLRPDNLPIHSVPENGGNGQRDESGIVNGDGQKTQLDQSTGFICVRTMSKTIDGVSYVQISMRDNGCGIEEDHRRQIFEPFFTTKGSHGTGLGLAMSQGIVQLHGGTISVESEVGEGTEFIVSLPTAKSTSQKSQTGQSKSPVGLRGRHILIVDDEASIRSLMSRVFTAEEMIVHTACNGEEAIDLLSRQPHEIDLIMLDWKMPVRSGKETLPWLKREFPHVPVIVCSGYVYEAEGEFGQSKIAPDYYLQKPFRVHDMIQKARSALTGREVNG